MKCDIVTYNLMASTLLILEIVDDNGIDWSLVEELVLLQSVSSRKYPPRAVAGSTFVRLHNGSLKGCNVVYKSCR